MPQMREKKFSKYEQDNIWGTPQRVGENLSEICSVPEYGNYPVRCL